MSIFHLKKTLRIIRQSLFILFTVVNCILFLIPSNVYAQESPDGENRESENAEESEASTNDKTVIFTKDIFHRHTGSSGGGGCYNVARTGTKTIEIPCGGSMVYWPELDTSSCSRCGAGYSGDQSGRGCWHKKTRTESYTYYVIGCGRTESDYLGRLTVVQSTTEWTKQLTLTGSYENAGKMTVAELPYIWNGGSATDNPVYEVTESGVYTLQLNADANANTAAGIVTVDVRNVDVTAPKIMSHIQEPVTEWVKDGVLVTVTEVLDKQPDNSDGCGLHELPYSYDNGETWTAEKSHLYSENGMHSILVRDKLENTSSYEVEFYNVDCTPPTIEAIEYDHTKNIRTTELSVSANDLQPDGSEGCGLHETPYSFDNGKTWTADNRIVIDKNGIIQIAVRDKLENIVYIEETIGNIDWLGPAVEYKMVHSSWTNQDVKLYLSAKDLNEDGSEGIGLADTWYSLDGGKSWSNTPMRILEENQEIDVTARDKHFNITKQHISVRQIDKVLPWVTVRMQITGEGENMQVILYADAGDDYSGIHEDGYSWDKGCSFSNQTTLSVTQNGIYQATVRDKAGNISYAQIEVDVFKTGILPLPIKPHKPITVHFTDENDAEEEKEITDIVVKQEKRIEKPEKTVPQLLEKEMPWQKVMLIAVIILSALALLMLILFLLSRTIIMYADDLKGKQQRIGALWISYKEEHLEVKIPEHMIEQCRTLHFAFRTSFIFCILHKGEKLHFIFPEEICVTLPVEKRMEMTLL